jgi:hypothetical protein
VTRRGIILVIVGSVAILLFGVLAFTSANAALRSEHSLVLPVEPSPGFERMRSVNNDAPGRWPFTRQSVSFTTDDAEWLVVDLYEAPSPLLALLFAYVVLPPEPDMPNYELGVAVDELEGIGFGRRDAIQCGDGEIDACQGWVYWSFSGDQILTVVLWDSTHPAIRHPR